MFSLSDRKFELILLDLPKEFADLLFEYASSLGMSVNEFVTFLCVSSVSRYRASRDKNNEKDCEVKKDGI